MQKINAGACGGVSHGRQPAPRAVQKLAATNASASDVRVSDRSLIWNTDLIETMELENSAGERSWLPSGRPTIARKAAARRRARTIRIAMTANWMKHTLSWVNTDGNVRLDYRPVHSHTLTDEVEAIPPKARVY